MASRKRAQQIAFALQHYLTIEQIAWLSDAITKALDEKDRLRDRAVQAEADDWRSKPGVESYVEDGDD